MTNDAPLSPRDPFDDAHLHSHAEWQSRMPAGGERRREFMVAIHQEEMGDYDRAIDHWIRYLRHDPNNALANLRLGVCLAAIGEHDGALGPLHRAMELDPALQEPPVRYALSALHVGCAHAAVSLMEEVLQKEKEYPFAVLTYAAALCCITQREQAHTLLQSRDVASSVSDEFFRNLSRSLTASGQSEYAAAVESPFSEAVLFGASVRSR